MGTVDGVFDNQRATRSDGKCPSAALHGSCCYGWDLRVGGKVGAIQGKRVYRLEGDNEPQISSSTT